MKRKGDDDDNNDDKGSGKVRVTTLATVCKKRNIERINFLSVDIEGNEYRLFKKARLT